MFSSAALVGAPGARNEAARALDMLVETHAASPLGAISQLYALLDAFRDLKIASRVGTAIADDITERILAAEQAMLARAAPSNSPAPEIFFDRPSTRSC